MLVAGVEGVARALSPSASSAPSPPLRLVACRVVGTSWSKAMTMSEPSSRWTSIDRSGRQHVPAAVEMAGEAHALLADLGQLARLITW